MTQKYPGGFVTLTPPTLDPALGAATQGIWTLDQALTAAKLRSWPMYDPYYNNVVLNLHGNGTNGAQNNTFLDSSTNNFTITRNGNTTQGTFSPYGQGWSNYFSGANGDALYLPSSSNLAVGTGDFCLELWAYRGASGQEGLYSNAYGAGGGNTVLELQIYLDKFVFNSWSTTFLTGTSTIALNTWYHVAVCRSGTTMSLFVNGVREATTTSANDFSSTSVFYIGKQSASTSTAMNGYISNLRLVKGSSVYTPSATTLTVPTSSLENITNTQLLTCQSNRFKDNSNNAFALTANGGTPSVQRFQPFLFPTSYTPSTIGGSGYFDGTGDYLSVPQNAAFNLGTGQFTVECNVYWNGTGLSAGGYNLISLGYGANAGGPFTAWAIYMDFDFSAGGKPSFYRYDGTGYLYQSSSALRANQWNHIAVSRNSSNTLSMWVNGVRVYTGTVTTSFNNVNTNPLVLGYREDGGVGSPHYFPGYIADARVVVGSDVYGASNSTITVPTAPLTAVSGTSLLTSMTNGAIYDNAMMSNLETVGNAQISTSVKKYGTGSIACTTGTSYLLSQPSQNLEFGGGDFTIEMWWYPTTTTRQALYHGSFGADWSIGIDYSSVSTNQKIGLWASSNGTSWNLINSDSGGNGIGATNVTQNAWNHIAFVRSGTTWMLYLNGVRDLNLTGISGSVVNRSTYQKAVGAWWSTANAPYPQTGYIDDFRITKGVARYVANFTPPTSQLQDQ